MPCSIEGFQEKIDIINKECKQQGRDFSKMGLSLSNYVVTEAGFGADLGAEKFLNLKCVHAGLKPKTVVIVATIRALRHHGGAKKEEYNTPNVERVSKGMANLEKHIENIKKFGLNPVVAINKFISDSDEETKIIVDGCAALGVKAIVSDGWANGGNGTQELAKAVVDEVENGNGDFKALYDWSSTNVVEKMDIVAKQIYGADEVVLSKKAEGDLRKINDLGMGHLPICMAKTQNSFSDDPKVFGRPTGFSVTVREFEIAAGAGFIVPILGFMMRMPGLPATPASEGMDIDENGVVSGLS